MVPPLNALYFGICLGILSFTLMVAFVNVLSAVLTLFALLFYVATLVLVIGVARKIRSYARTPAPLRIPTTPAPVTRGTSRGTSRRGRPTSCPARSPRSASIRRARR